MHAAAATRQLQAPSLYFMHASSFPPVIYFHFFKITFDFFILIVDFYFIFMHLILIFNFESIRLMHAAAATHQLQAPSLNFMHASSSARGYIFSISISFILLLLC
jgi:hypothetical protein